MDLLVFVGGVDLVDFIDSMDFIDSARFNGSCCLDRFAGFCWCCGFG